MARDPWDWLGWASLPLLGLIWQGVAWAAGSRFLPSPLAVAAHLRFLAQEAHLYADFGQTLLRAGLGFAISLGLGCVLGLALGRVRWLDRLFGPWVVVGMNLPAIVLAILCYIWLGLTDFALVLAVVLNKVPLVTATIAQGVRSFDPDYDELARAFRMSRGDRLRLIYLPQLTPHVLTAARSGLALVWKIVLVFEVLGSDGGVGFRISLFFQFFDMKGILAYSCAFVALIMALEYLILRPLEERLLAWQSDRT
jgi:NitT/TauT family transport system permease protein